MGLCSWYIKKKHKSKKFVEQGNFKVLFLEEGENYRSYKIFKEKPNILSKINNS